MTMPPETNDEPDTENDAAKEEEDSEERPEDHPGCHRRYRCAQLRPGSLSSQVTPASQRGPQVASGACHPGFLSSGHPPLGTGRVVPGTDICIGCPAAGKSLRLSVLMPALYRLDLGTWTAPDALVICVAVQFQP